MLENNEPPAEKSDRESSAGESDASKHGGNGATHDEFIAQLKQGLEKTRLPPELREQILAAMPPPDERARLYQEMREHGGLSSEEFFASLGLTEPKP